MATSQGPFRGAGNVSLAATTTTSNVAMSGSGDTVLVTNSGTTVAFVTFGADASVTATAATGTPVLGGQRISLAVNSLVTFAAAIMASATATVYFTRGDGASG